MKLIPKECIIVEDFKTVGAECSFSVRLDRHNKAFRKWAWAFAREAIAKCRIPFWYWPKAAWRVGRFMWAITR